MDEYSEIEVMALEAALAYLEDHAMPIGLDTEEGELFRIEPDGEEFLAFELEVEGEFLMVSMEDLEVVGIWRGGSIAKPHLVDKGISREEAKEIVVAHLGKAMERVEIETACFYFNGIHEHPKPCWLVLTENLNARMEGAQNTDYIIDPKRKQVVGSLSS